MSSQPGEDIEDAPVPEETSASLVSARLLTKNVGWNLVGTVLPLAGILLATPAILDILGVQALGLMSIAWAAIGYFALLDLGLGRTVTHFASRAVGGDESLAIRPLILTVNSILLSLGTIFALILFLSSGHIAGAIAGDSGQSVSQVSDALKILSAAIPFVMVGTGFRGLLQSFQRFGVINAIRVPIATATYLAPALAAHMARSLTAAMIALVTVRIVGAAALALASRGLVPRSEDGESRFLSLRGFKIVAKYGGWLTASSIISPVLTHIDKVLVTVLVSLSAVAYYSTSFDVATKLLILPASVASVAFPALSMTTATRSARAKAGRVYRGSTMLSSMMLVAAGTLLAAISSSGLTIWLGQDFARNATTVLVILIAGSVVNGVAHAPYGLIQAVGRPDITAKLHLAEAPIYISLAIVLTSSYGIIGAAVAWGLRVAIDAAALIWFSGRLFPREEVRRRGMLLFLLGGPAAVAISAIPVILPLRVGIAIAATIATLAAGWWGFLRPSDRTYLKGLIPFMPGHDTARPSPDGPSDPEPPDPGNMHSR